MWVAKLHERGSNSSIAGKKFNDADGNGTQDIGEPGLQNWTIKIEPGPIYAITDVNGEYYVPLDEGNYTVSEIADPLWTQTYPASPGTHTVNLTTGQHITGIDFGNTVVQSAQDLAVSVGTNFPWPLQSACCGQVMTYQINYSNPGTVTVSNASIDVILSPDAQYQSTILSSPTVSAPTQASGNILVYTLPTPLLPGASGVIEVRVLLTCMVSSTPLIITNMNVEPLVGDANNQNNSVMVQDQVSCSYDPNDMNVTPHGCGAEGYITSDDSLNYTIRFQNLGSGPAYHVVIRDTLDSNLDVSTVTTLGSSHPYVLTTNGNELIWTFWGIVLPPEIIDEPGSHGYVRFKVKQNTGNPVSTVIQNRAGIYFDLNEVVLTNQSVNTITTDPIPIANFDVTPVCLGSNCSYNFTYTGGTTDATFEWNFGADAVPQTSTDQNPTGVTYNTFSKKNVSLRVILGPGCISEPAIKTLTNQFVPSLFSVERGWNLVSLPIEVSDYTKATLFPTAASNAFSFDGGYSAQTTLHNGIGYWLKFASTQQIFMTGSTITLDTIELEEGWNLIGSINVTVTVETITTNPPGLITSQFFGYNNGYSEVIIIEPGKGYWVKANQAGTLTLSSTFARASTGKIHIVKTSELPPPPPDAETNSNSSSIPSEFALEQNYPNPFNPTTIIKYSVPSSQYVSLKIYDMLGREVATLVEGMQSTGFKSVPFDASKLPSGVYTYRLTSGNFTKTKNMLLLK